ncbi:PPOX class F420-dependent oxidoreductase [Streptomyces sp. A1277]|uniref:PPOX class F420-dependent oxidoreductase n=1 Tax=Streptomyces sp. A1277 TaxID=2563103 RepID=UPI0010A2A75A|nr:PPOX class F420-dependent oxidoreductase [Streptomyces sp. A1277]THA32116.1 PPOX class F420-dependent oxidoreductase [Streptomyces sp. A1277]
MDTIPQLKPYVKQYTVLLSTRRQDGTRAYTPVHIAVEGDHAYIRTFSSAWKVERMRNHPVVRIGPCTVRGRPTGPQTEAHARLLPAGSKEDTHAARMLSRKYPATQGVLVPLTHRIKRDRTLHYEIRPLDA